ncbi:alpha/beta-hydrolase [Leucogyrophana mollusca]|uniref:Alpha/beta-hydrolase n=1 Tax=Leucogyrophana mollusca TaxID=85980 RepID=A0ACB8BN42_9AGAM|nr:alpha/beta-hydrolase [Leucogyrophana mollusca]
MSSQAGIKYYHHGRFKVAGGVLPDAVTAYETFGDPKNPCIVYPTAYGGKLGLGGQTNLVGTGKVLDPEKYFIVTFALFCNGESSSPSNTPVPYNGPYFPYVSYTDNIRAQYAVLTKELGVSKVYSVVGFSMGGQQAYHWAVVFPDFVEKIAVIVSSARTSPHNQCLLEGPKSAMLASKDFDGGHYTSKPQHGMRAFGRVIIPWVFGQTWFREHSYLFDGDYDDLHTFIRGHGEAGWLENWDANDMIALLKTWQTGDISQVRDGGDYEKALRSIKAQTLLMPSNTDLMFPPEDSEVEMTYLQNAKLVLIDTTWGHNVGNGAPTDLDFFYHHGRFKVAGGILPDAVTAYQTYGDPQNPCIVFPTCYGAKLALGSKHHCLAESLIKSCQVLDPRRYFIVTFALFCNGEVCKSSSPSNTHAVLTKLLGVKKVFCVVGFSMGGQQAYHWPVVFPDFVDRFVAICTSARTSPHNRCFLEGPKSAMLASKDFEDGHYKTIPQHGIRAFGRVYCAWAYGQTWFREHKYLMDGEYPDLNAFIRERWEGRYLQYWDANDMVALLNTWQNGDISKVRDEGNYEKALSSIKAKALIMPSKTDLYFPVRLLFMQPEDSEIEVSLLKDAKLHVIPTVWGHVAGGGANPPDVEFISNNIRQFLDA